MRVALALGLAAVALALVYRWVDPPITWLMLSERLRLGAIERDWVPLSAMSDYLPLSAAAAEDADFCLHWGFDVAGIRAALADTDRLRGGSTISQQVAKNVFLWPARSWLRKGLEAGFTMLIEALWPKRRIMEVYLNVAEFDEGVFGVEAAARRYWGVGAADLGPQRVGPADGGAARPEGSFAGRRDALHRAAAARRSRAALGRSGRMAAQPAFCSRRRARSG